jgi:hypothetical protein
MPSDSFLAAAWAVLASSFEPFGALGVLAGVLAGLMPRRGLILVASSLCSALFAAHFMRLGSSTGAAMAGLSVLQSLAATAIRADAPRPRWLAGLFGVSSLVTVALTGLTWTGWPSAFAGTGALLATAARWQADAQAMRRLLLGCSLAWAGHNLLIGSLFGLTCDLLTLAGLTAALWRFRAEPLEAARATPA